MPDFENKPEPIEDEVKPRKRRRRALIDMGKIAGAAVLGSGALLEISARIKKEVPPSARVLNGLKVLTELTKAQLSGNEEDIHTTRKLLLAWGFAESSSLLAEKAKYGQAGKMLEHFLYGHGEAYDISALLDKELKAQPRLLSQCLKESFVKFCYEVYKDKKDFNMSVLTADQFILIFNQFKEQFAKTGGTAIMAPSSTDLYHSLGRSTYRVVSTTSAEKNANSEYGDHGIDVSMLNSFVALFDRYDWDITDAAGLSSKAGSFVATVSGPEIDQMMERIGFPEKYRQMVRDAIRSIPQRVGEIEGWATGSEYTPIMESDMGLLLKIGAQNYDIHGTAVYTEPFRFTTDTAVSTP